MSSTVPSAVEVEQRPLPKGIPTGWRLVGIIGGLSIFGPLCVDMYLPALPQLSSNLHTSAASVELTLTGCFIGIAVGQILFGGISDRFGRRRPLLGGLTGFVVMSLACVFAPNVYVLMALRFLQGMFGAAGMITSRAIVRDIFSGDAAARFFSFVMLMSGLGPILAPELGAGILHVTSWRGIFVSLAVIGAILLVVAAVRVPETLPVERRHPGSAVAMLNTVKLVSRDRVFCGYAIAGCLGLGAAFAYISGSSFVLQDVYGLSPQIFGVVFSLNGIGIVIGSQVNGRLVNRLGARTLLTFGLSLMCAGGFSLLVIVLTKAVGLPGVLPCLFVILTGVGFVLPNSMALALQNYGHSAASAVAILGSTQFLMGAVIAPLVGIAGKHTAVPMALCLAVLAVASLTARLTLARSPSSSRRVPIVLAPEAD